MESGIDMNNKIDFFLVGAAKSCTTTLHKILSVHPAIYVPDKKEINYFSQDILRSTRMFGGLPEMSESAYYDLYAGCSTDQLKGDCSISYLQHEVVAERLYEHNSNAKIIIALRNPVERALSHYFMDRRLGLVDIEVEEFIRDKVWFSEFYHQYIKVSQYSINIAKYRKYFPDENILIIRQEWMSDQGFVRKKLAEFLKINEEGFPAHDIYSNKRKLPRNAIFALLYKSEKLRSLPRILFSDRLYNFFKKLAFKAEGSPYINPKSLDLLRKELGDELKKYESNVDYFKIS
ncbi:MAG: hypothetical protein DHS20C13_27840 [Thermodesulfobacteriota bacterium]|nr:MAG: hypothetical protein DHS20C13_27840 [Thermodesulfobacteriota bacterium]